ncbi:MAG: 3'-5' exonuclease [Caldilineaceae bacterium]
MTLDRATARREAVAKAQELVAAHPIFLDTETTGVRSTAEVIEICVLDHNGAVLLDSLVRPRFPIPADATRIHGISDTMVAAAPDWLTLWPQLEPILAAAPIGIYNADFDLRMFKQSHRHAGSDWPTIQLTSFCIMLLYSQFYGEWDVHRNAYRWQSLEKAGRYFRIALPNSHRAKDDALLARAVLHHIANAKG